MVSPLPSLPLTNPNNEDESLNINGIPSLSFTNPNNEVRSLDNNGLPGPPQERMADIIRYASNMVNSGERSTSSCYILLLGLLALKNVI